MRITQRQVAIGMQTLLLAGTLAILIFQIITGDDLIPIITTIIGLAVGGTVLFLFWRGGVANILAARRSADEGETFDSRANQSRRARIDAESVRSVVLFLETLGTFGDTVATPELSFARTQRAIRTRRSHATSHQDLETGGPSGNN